MIMKFLQKQFSDVNQIFTDIKVKAPDACLSIRGVKMYVLPLPPNCREFFL